jgi:hypothetical protein
MRKFICFLFLVLVLFCGGCDILGWIINDGPYDRKVTAEFKIKDRADEKVMVFVDQAAGSDAGIQLRAELRDAISTFLVDRAGVKRKYLVVESEVDIMRRSGGSYLNYKPTKIALDAGAGLILYTRILDYKLYQSGPKGYYIGSLTTASVIIDSKLEKIVWPADGQAKVVKMEVGIESQGKDETDSKLMTSTAHGIVRHLYNIRYQHFRTSLEKVDSGEWKYD